jgi:hypothetical protein
MRKTFLKIRDMISVLHLPYSPYIPPSNFYLFAAVKERLEHAGVPNHRGYSKNCTGF